jgi:hypothetical protein
MTEDPLPAAQGKTIHKVFQKTEENKKCHSAISSNPASLKM